MGRARRPASAARVAVSFKGAMLADVGSPAPRNKIAPGPAVTNQVAGAMAILGAEGAALATLAEASKLAPEIGPEA